jgi:hypothetical protein
MKAFLLILFGACLGSAQTPIRNLPKGAVVVETASLATARHSHRMLVLWMQSPKKNPTGYSADDIYTCPDSTRGSYYSGPTRVSLVNTQTGAIINTIKIGDLDAEGGDSFDLPYAIRKGNYYRVVARVAPHVEAKPNLIWLKDYNGDGRPLEFALFEAEACMGLQTTLIGYSEKQDRVINYPIVLDAMEEGKHKQQVSTWADYLFHQKPQRPGYWKYEIDYRGRGGSLDKWEVQYNAAKEHFEGTLVSTPGNFED